MIDRGALSETDAAADAALLLARLGHSDRAREILDRRVGWQRAKLLADLAEAAASHGQPDRAEEYGTLLREQVQHLSAHEAPWAMARVARLFLLRGDRTRAHELAESAFNALAGVEEGRYLRELGGPLARAGETALALKCVRRDDDDWMLGESEIAENAAEAGNVLDAVAIAVRLLDTLSAAGSDTFWNTWITRHCIAALVKANRLDLATQKTQLINDPKERTQALIMIAQAYGKAGKTSRALGVTRVALDLVHTTGDSPLPVEQAQLAAILSTVDRAAASNELRDALRAAQGESSEAFFETLVAGAPMLASLDGGNVLFEILHTLARAPTVAQR